ncbi:MAG: dihydrodipicolinate synthase family protein, partial [Chloroflexi bacterium]|nr:dihydrodipicolinate synthase family protein [Chloroflexota bacterium]
DCLIGNSMLMLPAMTIGATGCVDGPPNYAPELWVDIWNAYQDGDWERAEAAQDRASDATLLAREYGLHPTAKFILSERLGIDCGSPRPPGLPLTAPQQADVLARMSQIGIGKLAVAQGDD